ncbi:unnamed protein product [Pleuronectes platessa]|uniref:Uncharacterized protein n=1 Tax=Pleuronectes platessa TaxID=8262 RepID=A0A9N7YQ76_PLEPL|nr:unnamed protein product [Pleuronectes platessa]
MEYSFLLDMSDRGMSTQNHTTTPSPASRSPHSFCRRRKRRRGGGGRGACISRPEEELTSSCILLKSLNFEDVSNQLLHFQEEEDGRGGGGTRRRREEEELQKAAEQFGEFDPTSPPSEPPNARSAPGTRQSPRAPERASRVIQCSTFGRIRQVRILQEAERLASRRWRQRVGGDRHLREKRYREGGRQPSGTLVQDRPSLLRAACKKEAPPFPAYRSSSPQPLFRFRAC